jgi:hypothetical protein
VTIPVALSCLSICIALLALSVAAANFRLSRFPHARFFPNVFSRVDGSSAKSSMWFEVEVESWGLPIWDAKLMLEGQYLEGEGPGRFSVQFQPVGTIPQPMNAGQVGKWRLNAKEIDDPHMTSGWRKLGFSDLPHERVRVILFGSGNREVGRLKSKAFPLYFQAFDSINGKPTPRKPNRRQRKEWRRMLRENPKTAAHLGYANRQKQAVWLSSAADRFRVKIPPRLLEWYVGKEPGADRGMVEFTRTRKR